MNTQAEPQFCQEKKIAQEALKEIMEWLESVSHSRGMEKSQPAAAIKFCGGCNPQVDRVAIARILGQKLQGKVFFTSAEEEIELLILIHGCAAACADRPEITRSARRVLNLTGKAHEAMRINHPLCRAKAERDPSPSSGSSM